MTDHEPMNEHQTRERQGSNIGLSITMLLIGVGAGALTALLLTPYSGRQTRRMLRRKYEDAVDTLNERAEDWKERGSQLADAARGWVRQTAENASEKIRPVTKEAKG